MARIGVLALGRPTFDVPFAEEKVAAAFAALDAEAAGAGHRLVGPRGLLFDAAAAGAGLDAIEREGADGLLILQATFTDAAATVALARRSVAGAGRPLAIWAFPEPRAGGRLRLNAFCGLNLAAHALGRAALRAAPLYAAPGGEAARRALELAARGGEAGAAALPPLDAPVTEADREAARAGIAALRGGSIGLVGAHPEGFDTCRFEEDAVERLTGARVERIALPDLFARADAVPRGAVESLRRGRVGGLAGIEAVDQDQLARSLGMYEALAGLSRAPGRSGPHAALAVRCWPEMFTEHGCAACGPMGMLTEDGVACACEADMFGAITATMLGAVAGEPAWLVDVVDADEGDDTAVFWHCGSAPMTMRDADVPAEAQIHTNRRMPLLAQFTLKPGRVTFARLSQARGEVQWLVGAGEMIPAPMPFTGTSGTLKPDGGAGALARALLGGCVEHHVAVVYGDHAGAVAALGQAMGVPARRLHA